MKANELRKDNLVKIESSNITLNIKLTPWDIYNFDIGFSSIVPIPLSTDILLKAGFTNHKEPVAKIETWNIKGDGFWFSIIVFESEKCYLFNSPHYSFKIEYVHQLQNLFFALTGEELNIEL